MKSIKNISNKSTRPDRPDPVIEIKGNRDLKSDLKNDLNNDLKDDLKKDIKNDLMFNLDDEKNIKDKHNASFFGKSINFSPMNINLKNKSYQNKYDNDYLNYSQDCSVNVGNYYY